MINWWQSAGLAFRLSCLVLYLMFVLLSRLMRLVYGNLGYGILAYFYLGILDILNFNLRYLHNIF